jgi:lactate permease
VRRLALPVLIMGIVMGSVHLLIGVSPIWNIAGFCAGLAGLLVAYPLARRWRNGDDETTISHSEKNKNGVLDRHALAVALSGYAILIILTLGIQIIPSVSDFLGQVVIQVKFPEVSTAAGYVTPAGAGRKIPLFRHAGAILTYATILAYLVYRKAGCYQPGAPKRILGGMVQRVMASSVSIASMVTMAVVMENSGMTETLARGLADAMGRAYPLIAPWIGGLGAFMTGSNTNSMWSSAPLARAAWSQWRSSWRRRPPGAGWLRVGSDQVVVGTSTAGMAGQEAGNANDHLYRPDLSASC